MGDSEFTLFFLLLCGAVLLIVIRVIQYLIRYFVEIKRAKEQLEQAHGWKEYVYWERELSALRWSVLPGMTPDTVKRTKHFFCHRNRRNAEDDGLHAMLLPSILSICICTVCLAGSTFAWFTASSTALTQTIQSAEYTVTTTVKNGTADIPLQNGKYVLTTGTYDVKITATGNASAGYCIIRLQDAQASEEWLTVPFPDGEEHNQDFAFRLDISGQVDLTIIPQWGSSAQVERLNRGELKSFGTPYSQSVSPEEPADAVVVSDDTEASAADEETDMVQSGDA